MKIKKVKAAILIALFGLLIQGYQAQSIQAKSLGTYKIKIINPKKSYGVYSTMSTNGPRGWLVNTKTLKYGHYQSIASRKVKGRRYWYVYIDGRKAGWVNENAFAKSKIAVAKKISLVYNPNYKFSTKDAINYVTDKHGTVVPLGQVQVTKKVISSSKIGIYKIKYRYGKATATATVKVRENQNEGIAEATAVAQPGVSAKTWFKPYKTSGNWKGSTKSHTLKSKGLTLKTVFYQPATMNIGTRSPDATGPVPEGVTVSGSWMYASMYAHPGSELKNQYAHIVGYNTKAINNKYIMQWLSDLPWSRFVKLAKHVKVSPYIKLGHGQTLSSTNKYLYVIANNHTLKNSSQSEEIMQIDKKNLQIKQIWTFKIWRNFAKAPKYIHNAVFTSDNNFYAVHHNGTKHQFEYWEVTHEKDEWVPKQVGVTKGDFMSNGSPVQGFTYDKKNKQFYLAFNDYIFKIARNGKLMKKYHFNTGREIEGLSIRRNILYVELAQKPELLSGSIK